jgi:hypothetical protein
MKARNPMRNASAREKMRNSLIKSGHKPTVRGGNGTGATVSQSALTSKITESGMHAQTEFIVACGMGRGNGYPTHYKIDIAIPSKMIAIEVDGLSHCSTKRKQQDARKQSLLESLGWIVLRFTNQQVMEDLDGCFQTVLSTTLRSTEITTISQMAA